jgi:hypothetical protein
MSRFRLLSLIPSFLFVAASTLAIPRVRKIELVKLTTRKLGVLAASIGPFQMMI